MSIAGLFVAFFVLQIRFFEASYECGVRKHSFVPLIYHGWKVEEGQWPWHVALFHRKTNGSIEYACGGTLISEKHVLTAAHCVVNEETQYPLPTDVMELHFGQQNLSKIANHTRIRDVSEVHVHHEFSTHRNDIAVLVTRLSVEYTDFIVPICMDQRADSDLRNLIGQRGWITGWGKTQNGFISDVLRTASMPVVDYLECNVYGNLLTRNVFCAGDQNGTSPGKGDSGGGMYFNEGDRWILRGIISFTKVNESNGEVDTSKYAVFVNIQRFLPWITNITDEAKQESAKGPKRKSEIECDRFKGLARKRGNQICSNSRHQHTVQIIYTDGIFRCSGTIVSENHVLTVCHCKEDKIEGVFQKPETVRIDAHGDIGVKKFTCHPQYSKKTKHHDLAVIELSTSIKLSSNLIPACLASNWTENLYDTLLASYFTGEYGFSFGSFDESDTNKVISQEKCNKLFKENNQNRLITLPSQLCSLNYDKFSGFIWGSSGSPLQSVNSHTCMYTAVGLASLIVGISSDEYHGIDIYTRISSYLDWIEEIVWHIKPPMATTSRAPSIYTDIIFPDD